MVKNKTVKFGKIGGKNGKIGKCLSKKTWLKNNIGEKENDLKKNLYLEDWCLEKTFNPKRFWSKKVKLKKY